MTEILINGKQVHMNLFKTAADLSAALEFVGRKPDAVVVCIDTAPKPPFVEFVRELHAAGRRVIVRDHHKPVLRADMSAREREILAAAQQVEDLLGGDATLTSRVDNPACSLLVDVGEFSGDDFIIVADADADGLTASAKALGVTYPELDADAVLLDGPGNKRGDLSPLGRLLNEAGSAAKTADQTKQKVWQVWINAVCSDADSVDFLQSLAQQYQGLKANAEALAATAVEVATGVYFVSAIEAPVYSGGEFMAAIEARPECIAYAVLEPTPAGENYPGGKVEFGRRTGTDLNLHDFLPVGFAHGQKGPINASERYRIKVSLEVWEQEVLPRVIARFGAM